MGEIEVKLLEKEGRGSKVFDEFEGFENLNRIRLLSRPKCGTVGRNAPLKKGVRPVSLSRISNGDASKRSRWTWVLSKLAQPKHDMNSPATTSMSQRDSLVVRVTVVRDKGKDSEGDPVDGGEGAFHRLTRTQAPTRLARECPPKNTAFVSRHTPPRPCCSYAPQLLSSWSRTYRTNAETF